MVDESTSTRERERECVKCMARWLVSLISSLQRRTDYIMSSVHTNVACQKRMCEGTTYSVRRTDFSCLPSRQTYISYACPAPSATYLDFACRVCSSSSHHTSFMYMYTEYTNASPARHLFVSLSYRRLVRLGTPPARQGVSRIWTKWH